MCFLFLTSVFSKVVNCFSILFSVSFTFIRTICWWFVWLMQYTILPNFKTKKRTFMKFISFLNNIYTTVYTKLWIFLLSPKFSLERKLEVKWRTIKQTILDELLFFRMFATLLQLSRNKTFKVSSSRFQQSIFWIKYFL